MAAGRWFKVADFESALQNGKLKVEYFFYNTDAGSIRDQPRPRFHLLIENGFAAAGGARKYGERFEQLAPGDTLLMYENLVGVVAIGRVQERWDGVSHTTPRYYTGREELEHLDGGEFEYRIPVKWFLSDTPISVKEIKKRLGNTPRGVVRRIVEKRAEAARIVEELSSITPAPAPEAADLESPIPERITTSVHRIIRDTLLARRVKVLNRHKCQICSHTIQLPDGTFYAEAHHIQPLGKPHNGPDVIGNILCVCPNHHAELDYGVIQIAVSELACVKGHAISPQFVDYHNERICPYQ